MKSIASGRVILRPGLATLVCALYAGPVAAQPNEAAAVLFEELPVVEAVALHAQTLDEAPANVTVITSAEIRRYGYRTLGEALASVRGFYGIDDRYYQFFGARGVNLPGDYNTRFLVMLNGHPLTEIIYSSNGFFGQDFGLDMDMVERIEVIRGPTSALYGSNGMLANINIVTRSPVSHARARLSTEVDSLGQRKAIASASIDLGKGRNLLVSSSVFSNRGQSFFLPDSESLETGGFAPTRLASDAERGLHSFVNLLAGNWNVVGYFSRRQKSSPVPWAGDGVFDDPGNWVLDERNAFGAMYSRSVGHSGKLRWQTYFDQYLYRDRYIYDIDGERGFSQDRNPAEWVNSQLTYHFPVRWLGELTIGAYGSFEFRNRQHTRMLEPEAYDVIRIEAPDRQQAAFLQTEKKLSRRWTAHLGLRLDNSFNFGTALSPRAALVYQPTSKTTWKLVYGRPFRNPSAYEKYWFDDIFMLRPLNLRQETAHTFEGAVERKLSKAVTGVVNVYHYRLSNLIQMEAVGEGFRYRNFAHSGSTGIEGELQGSVTRRLGVHGSWAFQQARHRETGWLVNSPRHVAKVRGAYDLLPNKLNVSGALYALSRRRTHLDGEVPPVHLFDVTVSTQRLTSHFDLVAGVRNTFDTRFLHPVATAVDRMPGSGRSFFVKLVVRTAE